jgi:hypothetical protein
MPSVHPDVLDAALDELADSGNKLFVCSAEPTNYTEASATFRLVQTDLTTGDGNGDYAIANDVDGRKLTISQQTDLTVAATGTATHVAICDSTGTPRVLYVTTVPSQALTSGNLMSVPEFKLNLQQPVTA